MRPPAPINESEWREVIGQISAYNGHSNRQNEKATLVLSRDTSVWLDEQRAGIRRQSGTSVSRSQIVRGVLQGLADASMDFSQCTGEREICEAVVSAHRAATKQGELKTRPTSRPPLGRSKAV